MSMIGIRAKLQILCGHCSIDESCSEASPTILFCYGNRPVGVALEEGFFTTSPTICPAINNDNFFSTLFIQIFRNQLLLRCVYHYELAELASFATTHTCNLCLYN